jgi:hypothetical protein
MRVTALVLALCCVPAFAQPAMPTSFPEGAVAPAKDELQARLSGNVFKVKPFSGPDWRLEYKGNGYFFLNTGSGFSDSGQWKIDEGKLCSKGQKVSGCNEVRATAEHLFLKRVSGEVVTMVRQ